MPRFVQRRSSSMVQRLESRRLLSAAVEAPFLGKPVATNQIIEAENYDLGGSNVAYHVTKTVTVPGNAYRPGDAVGVQAGGSNGWDVGYTTAGEWLQYTISVPTAGLYSFRARVANISTGGLFHATVDSVNVTGSMAVPNTGAWQTYQIISTGNIQLAAGTHLLRIVLDRAGSSGTVGNFDCFEFVPAPAAPTVPLTLTWRAAAPIPQGLTEGGGEVVNGKLYVFSGFVNTTYLPTPRVYCYNPATNVWTRLHDMPVPVTHAGMTVVGNYIYIAGGYPPNATDTYQLFATSNVWRYDTLNDTWAAMPALPAARGAGQLVVLNNVLHYISGDDQTRAVDLTEHWTLNLANPGAGWTNAAPILTGRNRLGAVALDGKIYAIGGAIGEDADETAQSVVEVYDPTTNKWSEAARLPTPRALVMGACTVYDGMIIVAGGETSFGVATSQVTAYNPATNTWTQLTPLPLGRIGGICQNLGGMLIFTTGHPGFNANTWIGTFS